MRHMRTCDHTVRRAPFDSTIVYGTAASRKVATSLRATRILRATPSTPSPLSPTVKGFEAEERVGWISSLGFLTRDAYQQSVWIQRMAMCRHLVTTTGSCTTWHTSSKNSTTRPLQQREWYLCSMKVIDNEQQNPHNCPVTSARQR